MKNHSGFNILEFTVAISISVIIMSASASYLSAYSQVTKRFNQIEGVKNDLEISLTSVFREFKNISRLSPTEDFQNSNDRLYPGLYEVQNPPVNAKCVVDYADPSLKKVAFRMTAFESRMLPEKLLIAWNENYINLSNPPFQAPNIRLSYHDFDPVNKYLFQNGEKNADEIILVDADMLTLRRYSVSNVAVIRDLDPRTNTPSPGAVFNEVTLAIPKMISGSPLSPRPLSFITNSMAFPSITNIICVTANDEIILYDEATGTARPLLNVKSYDLKIIQFTVDYYIAKAGTTLQSSLFQSFPADPFERSCVSSLMLKIRLAPTSGTGLETTIKKIIPLDNFITDRPAGC